MQKVFVTFLFLTLVLPLAAQYYIRGNVKDERNQPLQNVKIYMPATRGLYHSGATGGFGIPASSLYDSLIFSADGFETRAIKIKADIYQEITLKMLAGAMTTQKQELISLTMGEEGRVYPTSYYNNESYNSIL